MKAVAKNKPTARETELQNELALSQERIKTLQSHLEAAALHDQCTAHVAHGTKLTDAALSALENMNIASLYLVAGDPSALIERSTPRGRR